MNKTVRLLKLASFLATFTASLTSLIPDIVADNLTNLKLLSVAQIFAITFAMDV